MNHRIRQVVILGGGSAGWLTAALLAAEHAPLHEGGLQITLIESPQTPPIGVGEGTWPSMRDTLRRIGVSETGLVRDCDAAFKQGSRFDAWVNGSPGDHYHHPFMLPQGYTDAPLAQAWMMGVGQAGGAQPGLTGPHMPFADLVSVQPHLCAHGRAPKQVTTPEYAAVANYGYHFDAGKFGVFLRQHAVQKLGVRHIVDHMVGVNVHDNGDIASLQTQGQGAVAGDLFVDCSGLPSLLLGGHYGVALRCQQQVLFNDAALAMQVPYPRPETPIASQTIATAQRHGWIWDIGLPTRRGVGHVFSSAHASADEVERDLRAHVAATGGAADLPVRHLRFTPGYRERFWHRNCVAIGLSSGFIEPLEASALALVELSAAMLSEEMPATREAMDVVAGRFNQSFGYRWSRIIEFLKLHYLLSRRNDSDYWRAHRQLDTVPIRLQEQLLLWRQRPPSRRDFFNAEEVFPSASYQYVLYGMGFRPDAPDGTRRVAMHEADAHFREAAHLTRRMLAALPDHRTLLDHVRQHGLQRI